MHIFDKIEFVKKLVTKASEINASVPSSGYTALHHAAKEGHAEIVEFLVESGANFTLETRKGFTPLHLAVKYANLAELKFLVDVGCDINARALGGLTCLHIAAHYAHVEITKKLLELGADPSISAARTGHTSLHVASRQANLDILRLLLEAGAPTGATTKQGFTAVHLSAFAGSVELLKGMVKKSNNISYFKIFDTQKYLTKSFNRKSLERK